MRRPPRRDLSEEFMNSPSSITASITHRVCVRLTCSRVASKLVYDQERRRQRVRTTRSVTAISRTRSLRPAAQDPRSEGCRLRDAPDHQPCEHGNSARTDRHNQLVPTTPCMACRARDEPTHPASRIAPQDLVALALQPSQPGATATYSSQISQSTSDPIDVLHREPCQLGRLTLLIKNAVRGKCRDRLARIPGTELR